MSLTNLTSLIFGSPSSVKIGETVTVCRVDGCMAEKLTPQYEGVVTGYIKADAKGAPARGGVPTIVLRAKEGGKTHHELADRLRTLEDGRKVIAN